MPGFDSLRIKIVDFEGRQGEFKKDEYFTQNVVFHELKTLKSLHKFHIIDFYFGFKENKFTTIKGTPKTIIIFLLK